MRLTCPNCGAQYEVAPEAIPAAGRDVQCSACGNIWFEQPSESRPRLIDPEPWDGPPSVQGDAEEEDDLAALRAEPRSAPPTAGAAIAGAAPIAPGAQAATEGATPDGLPPRPRVPAEVAGILREEAEREVKARAEDAARRAAPDMPQVPSEPEGERPAIAPRRLSPREPGETAIRPRPEEASPAEAPAAARSGRPARTLDREMDLDRINSTLRSRTEEAPPKAPSAPPRRSGFGAGFWGSLAVLAILAGLYAFRPQIEEAVPATAAVLDPYAEAVDRGRDWLDAQVGRLLGATPGADAPTSQAPATTPRTAPASEEPAGAAAPAPERPAGTTAPAGGATPAP